MPDYKNSRIYKLVSPSGLTYIGSTTRSLAQRKAEHKSDYVNANSTTVTSSALFADSLDGVVIVLLEEFPCDNKEQLFARERHYIDTLDCVNKQLKAKPDEKKTPDQRFYARHKARVDAKHKAKVHCGCGSEVNKSQVARHRRSNIHKEWEKHQVE